MSSCVLLCPLVCSIVFLCARVCSSCVAAGEKAAPSEHGESHLHNVPLRSGGFMPHYIGRSDQCAVETLDNIVNYTYVCSSLQKCSLVMNPVPDRLISRVSYVAVDVPGILHVCSVCVLLRPCGLVARVYGCGCFNFPTRQRSRLSRVAPHARENNV